MQSVHAIGRCAVALDGAAERCINVLLELIKSKVNYVVQECIVVIKDIFRRYPNRQAAKAFAASIIKVASWIRPQMKPSCIAHIGMQASN